MKEIKKILEENSYKVKCTRNIHEPITKIISHTDYATYKKAERLRTLIPELENVEFNLEPNNHYCGKSDYTIVLSNN